MSNKSNRGKSLPAVTSDIPADLRRYLDRVREALQGIDSAIDGRVSQVVKTYIRTSGGGGSTDPGTDPGGGSGGGDPDPDPDNGDPENPTTPINLVVDATPTALVVSWTPAAYFRHKHTELWAAPYDPETNPDPQVEDATLLGGFAGLAHRHPCERETGYRFWVRHVNEANVIGPWSDPAEGFVSWVEAPPDVTGLKAEADKDTIRVSWDEVFYLGRAWTDVFASMDPATIPSEPTISSSGDHATLMVGLGETWYFWAQHRNAQGETSERIGPVSATSFAGDVVPAPANVEAVYLSERVVQITWDTTLYAGLKGTRVYRSNGRTLVGDVVGSTVIDYAPTSAASSSYKVQHYNVLGVGGPMVAVTAEGDVDTPTAPVLTSAEKLYLTAQITWTYPPGYQGHAETIVYANGVEVGRSATSAFIHEPAPNKFGTRGTITYTARHVNVLGQVSGLSNARSVNFDTPTADGYIKILDSYFARTNFAGQVDQMPFMDVSADGKITGYGMGLDTMGAKAFIVAADKFIISAPVNQGASQSNPFYVLTRSTQINPETGEPVSSGGVVVPAGVYMKNAAIANASIDSAKIGSLRADKIIAGVINTGTITVASEIKSKTFDDENGWSITDKQLIANNAIIRGDIQADSGYFKGDITGSRGTFTGTLKGGTIEGATIAAGTQFTTHDATAWGSGNGVFIGHNSNGVLFRAGGGWRDPVGQNARLDCSNGKVRIIGKNNTVLFSAGDDDDDDDEEGVSASAITSGELQVNTNITVGNGKILLQGDGWASFKNAEVEGKIVARDSTFTGTVSASTIIGSTIEGAKVAAGTEFYTHNASEWKTGAGLRVHHDRNGTYLRIGYGWNDTNKARMEWHNDHLRVFGRDGSKVFNTNDNGISADVITSGTITSKTIELDGGAIQSKGFNASQGWRIEGNGDATFNTLSLRRSALAAQALFDKQNAAPIASTVSSGGTFPNTGFSRTIRATDSGAYLIGAMGTGWLQVSRWSETLEPSFDTFLAVRMQVLTRSGWLDALPQQIAGMTYNPVVGRAYDGLGGSVNLGGAVTVRTREKQSAAGTFSCIYVLEDDDVTEGDTIGVRIQFGIRSTLNSSNIKYLAKLENMAAVFHKL